MVKYKATLVIEDVLKFLQYFSELESCKGTAVMIKTADAHSFKVYLEPSTEAYANLLDASFRDGLMSTRIWAQEFKRLE